MRVLRLLILMTALFLAACNTVDPLPQGEAGTPETANEASVVEESTGQPVTVAKDEAVEAPTVTVVVEVETPSVKVDPSPLVEETNTAEPVSTEEPFSGAYENTYFRGSELAPVTLIDYSDFL